MKRNVILGLSMSVMLIGMIAVVTAPAFAVTAHGKPEMKNKFVPNTPKQVSEYVLTISGQAQLESPSSGFTRYHTNIVTPSINLRSGASGPSAHGWAPISGQVTIKVANLNVLAEKGSLHRAEASIRDNPSAVVFQVESGNVKIGDKTYAVNNGAAVYYKRFGLTLNGNDFVLNADGALSGGIPSTPSTQSVSNMSNFHSDLKVAGHNWIFDGGISMSKLT
ncbi:MAG: hypothetical protein HMLIMOIP_001213 [Candidatus Nitrosomirales archaeon]|jgi:hypothetical protein